MKDDLLERAFAIREELNELTPSTRYKNKSGENDVLEIHFIELNKFFKMWKDNALNKFDDILVRWLLLLSMVDGKKKKVYDDIYRELEELAMEDETLLRAFSAWEELSQSKENIITYQSRLKHILDEEGKLDDVRYLSEKKGEEKGRKERDLEINTKYQVQKQF